MGCAYYNFYPVRGRWKPISFHFSESQGEWSCLCTFPHNNGEQLDRDALRSLALLGAAVAMAHNGSFEGEETIFPHDVPEWVRKGIDALLEERRYHGSGAGGSY